MITARAQQFSDYDSIRRHELSAGFLPVFSALSGNFKPGQFTTFNVFYKYHTPKKWVLRCGLVFYPPTSLGSYDCMIQFSRTVDSFNVFFTQSTRREAGLQLNLGLEKIFSAKRLQQSLGGDIWVNHHQRYHQTSYFWYPDTVNFEKHNLVQLPFSQFQGGSGTYNGVDSLSYSYGLSGTGIGIQLFYNLRFRLHEKWYLNATAGPWFNIGFYRYRSGSGRFAAASGNSLFETDLLFLLISDLSLAFRF